MDNSGIIETSNKNYPKVVKDSLKKLIGSLGPKDLYCKGSISLLEESENFLAVVGSRKLTYYGRKATEQIVTECAGAGIVIVSGFMYGGDEAAHSSAIKCGGKTIAVMPCGVDLAHPPQHKKLYQDILDSGGLIISEYPGLSQPQTFTYVQRDRIVAALSRAVFVTEAAENSGSLVTSSYAKKMGKKVFALPGPITSEVSKGSIQLIREGAEAVSCARDILTFYKVLAGERKTQKSLNHNLRENIKLGISKNAALEDKILDQLGREPMGADDMARLFAVPVATLGTALSLMQLKGQINFDNEKYHLN